VTRQLAGGWRIAEQTLLGAAGLFYLWASAFGAVSLQYHRGIAVAFSLVAAFLLYRGSRRAPAAAPSVPDILLCLAACVGVGYWIVEHENIAYRAGAYTQLDFVLGLVVAVLALEASRRVVGMTMVWVTVAAILYAYFGAHLPTIIGHSGFGVRRLIEFVYLTSDGIFGVMAEVVASYIIPFVVFGAFMLRAGVAKAFIDLSMVFLGRVAGGPAQVAVVSSALVGSINGSPIANAAMTGAVTIPLMKRTGWPPHLAAAVEASASTGGMVLPPVMGAGAFIMAEMTRTPYAEIVKLSVIPALLFFLSVGIMVYCESRKLGLRGLRPEELPALGPTLRRTWYFFLPIVLLVAALFAGASPSQSVVYATIATVAVSWVRPEHRMGPRAIWEALVEGGRSAVFVGAITGAVGIIIGIASLTGIGIRFSAIVLTLSGESLLVALVLIALASLILGMGLPITASYLVIAAAAAPSLTEFGLPLLTAHLIIFWLSLDSNITPPVALGAYTAAAIAEADPWRTGWTSFRFAKLIYVMPLLFAYTHILFSGTPEENAWAIASAIVGTVAFSICSTGYFLVRTSWLEWLVLAAATVLAFIPTIGTDIAAFALFGAIYFWQRKRAAAVTAGTAAAADPREAERRGLRP
jgi:TRAP transporter 4TM/12TM fusion protein